MTRIQKLFTYTALGAVLALSPAKAEEPIVEVNGDKITMADVEVYARNVNPEMVKMLGKNLGNVVLEQLINAKLIYEKAVDEDFDDEDEVEKRIEVVTQDIIRQAFLEDYLQSRINDETIRAEYDLYVKENPEQPEIRTRHMLFDSKEDADKALKEVKKKGVNFGDYAKNVSKAPNSDRGGDLGYLIASQMPPSYAEVAFDLKKGRIASAPVKTDFGWHVIKMEDKRTRKVPKFDEAKQMITQRLAQKLTNQLIAELRKDADIEVIKKD